MVDSLGAGSFIASILNWLEARKLRKLWETKSTPQVAKSPVAIKPRRRRSSPRKSSGSAATMAALELRRKKLELERERLEWIKARDMAKAAKWVFDRMSEDDEDEDRE